MTKRDINDRLLSVRTDFYDKVMARLDLSVRANLTLDFQYVKFDNSQNRKERELAKVLVAHIVSYCLKEDRILEMKDSPVSFAWADARDLFTKRDHSGECGELLLYLLTETVLKAPQVLAKMSLKTNSNMEVHGSDGVHVRYNGPDKPIDIFLGESKIYGTASSALDDALASIDDVRANGIDREVALVTENFKWLDKDAQVRILDLLRPNSSSQDYRVHFVVLIGFQLKPHGNRKTPEGQEEFMSRYRRRAAKLTRDTLRKLDAHEERVDDIVHIFYVPFVDPQEFRKEFVRCLIG